MIAAAGGRDWLAKFLDPVEWLGLAAQLCFTARFAWQWFRSERAKRVVVPRAFWWLSLAGAVLMMVYAVEKGTLALLLAQLVALFFYARNLMLGGKPAAPGSAS